MFQIQSLCALLIASLCFTQTTVAIWSFTGKSVLIQNYTHTANPSYGSSSSKTLSSSFKNKLSQSAGCSGTPKFTTTIPTGKCLSVYTLCMQSPSKEGCHKELKNMTTSYECQSDKIQQTIFNSTNCDANSLLSLKHFRAGCHRRMSYKYTCQ